VSRLRALLVLPVVLLGAVLLPAQAGAAEPETQLVHANTVNKCKLNVRAGSELASQLLHTLTCTNYTTCVQPAEKDAPCGKPVVGGKYSCVGPDGKQVTDDRWAPVAWRTPQTAYIAVACAAFRK